ALRGLARLAEEDSAALARPAPAPSAPLPSVPVSPAATRSSHSGGGTGTTAPSATSQPPAKGQRMDEKASTPAASGSVSPGSAPTAGSSTSLEISIDQFLSVELRAARVELAERVPNANKLLRLVVDLGTEKRQIVAGIAEAYAPEDLVGKTIIVVANLKPAV